jgi:thiol-disulfide isomerase/thioredoxin
MRRVLPVLVAVFAVGCGGIVPTRPTVGPVAGDKTKLAVGDPAPPLTVTRWLNGEAVPTLEPGKVYVLEFWATWCGPCVTAMPHLTQLQSKYADKGLVVIGVTTRDSMGNNLDSVTKFVEKKAGGDLGYRVAYCDTPATDKAYMQAAGQEYIPCSFVIGRDGKLAFVGNPGKLDGVLPGLLK